LAAALDTSALARVKVNVESDPAFDFRPLKTWTWHPDGAGAVHMARTQDDDPAALQRLIEPIVLEAVGVELARKKLTAAARADVTLRYYALVTVGVTGQHLGQFLPSVTEWGLPPFAPVATSTRVIEQGSLVIDVMVQPKDRVVWRGVARAEIDRARSAAQREKRLRDAVGDLLRSFPPKRPPKGAR
jgi:hypothetical protein